MSRKQLNLPIFEVIGPSEKEDENEKQRTYLMLGETVFSSNKVIVFYNFQQ